jgi:hypothetical protein
MENSVQYESWATQTVVAVAVSLNSPAFVSLIGSSPRLFFRLLDATSGY